MTAKRFRKGAPITARQLNESVDAVNRLDVRQLPTQQRGSDDGPLVVDDENSTPLPNVESWDEVSRVTSTVRITNPEDSAQYVDVDRVESVTFRMPDGRLVQLRLSN